MPIDLATDVAPPTSLSGTSVVMSTYMAVAAEPARAGRIHAFLSEMSAACAGNATVAASAAIMSDAKGSVFIVDCGEGGSGSRCRGGRRPGPRAARRTDRRALLLEAERHSRA